MYMRTILPVLFAVAAFGQAPRPEFEVASIKPSPPTPPGQVSVGLHIDGAQVRCVYLSIKDYIGMAYRVKGYQISGPDWIASERFDISAKVPEGSTPGQFPEMTQTLLEERFQVKLHRDKKDLPAYVLEIAKGGHTLKESPESAAEDRGAFNLAAGGTANGVGVNLGNGSSYTFASNRFEAKKLSMADFAGGLVRFVDRPIVDLTELNGKYDFALDLTAEDYRAMLIRSAIASGVQLPPEALRGMDGATLGSLHESLQKLGLKMEARKAPLEVLVIDRVLKSPTDN